MQPQKQVRNWCFTPSQPVRRGSNVCRCKLDGVAANLLSMFAAAEAMFVAANWMVSLPICFPCLQLQKQCLSLQNGWCRCQSAIHACSCRSNVCRCKLDAVAANLPFMFAAVEANNVCRCRVHNYAREEAVCSNNPILAAATFGLGQRLSWIGLCGPSFPTGPTALPALGAVLGTSLCTAWVHPSVHLCTTLGTILSEYIVAYSLCTAVGTLLCTAVVLPSLCIFLGTALDTSSCTNLGTSLCTTLDAIMGTSLRTTLGTSLCTTVGTVLVHRFVQPWVHPWAHRRVQPCVQLWAHCCVA